MASINNAQFISRSSLGTTTDAVTFSGAVLAGSTLFMLIRMGSAATLNSISDSVNGAWTLLGPFTQTGRVYLGYVQNTGAGTPVLTLTFSATGQAPRYGLAEIRGTVATSFIASNHGQNTTGTAIDGGAASTGAITHAMIIGGLTAGANQTFSASGSFAIDGVEPTAGTSRIALVHQEVLSAGSYTAAITGSASGEWVGVTVAFELATSGISSSAVGRVGVRGTNTLPTVASSALGRVGLRGANVSSKTVTDFAVGGVGVRGVNVSTRAIAGGAATGRVGLRGFNNVASVSSSVVGRVGVRGFNAVSRAISTSVVGRLGLRGTNVASRAIAVGGAVARVGTRGTSDASRAIAGGSCIGRVGVSGQNTVQINGLTALGRVGTRGLNSGSAAHTTDAVGRQGVRGVNATIGGHTTDNVGRVGLRGVSAASRAIAAGGSIGRTGLRGASVSQRQMVGTSVGSVGARSVNTWVTGLPPEPVTPPIPNAEDCEPDWNLARFVTWPEIEE